MGGSLRRGVVRGGRRLLLLLRLLLSTPDGGNERLGERVRDGHIRIDSLNDDHRKREFLPMRDVRGDEDETRKKEGTTRICKIQAKEVTLISRRPSLSRSARSQTCARVAGGRPD